jgi:hypothetical protein
MGGTLWLSPTTPETVRWRFYSIASSVSVYRRCLCMYVLCRASTRRVGAPELMLLSTIRGPSPVFALRGVLCTVSIITHLRHSSFSIARRVP